MDELVNKYHKVLDDVDKPMWKQYAEALEFTIEHIKANEIEHNLRVPCAYVVKKILLDNDKFEIADIASIINTFLKYYKEEYEKYMEEWNSRQLAEPVMLNGALSGSIT